MDHAAEMMWKPCDYCLTVRPGQPGDSTLAISVYDRVCRTDFAAPGFALIDLPAEVVSTALRQFMVELKECLGHIHRARTGQKLVFLSAGRFDQQVTTKLHRDGGPDQCFLMLGYEPSAIQAEVVLADYSQCAFDMQVTPQEFLDRYNPMFPRGEELLRNYLTRVACFSSDHHQVLLINNSASAYGHGWQGVLHMAKVVNPCEEHRRVINSTMITSAPPGADEPITPSAEEEFVSTRLLRRAGYDRPHLEDDD